MTSPTQEDIDTFEANEDICSNELETSEQKNCTIVFFPECKNNQMLPFHICTAGSPQLIQKG